MMKKRKVFVYGCLFCLLAAGCSKDGGIVENTENSVVLEETEALENSAREDESEKTVLEEVPVTATELSDSESTILHFVSDGEESGEISGTSIPFSNEDSTRITYTKEQNFVAYINSAEELAVYNVEKLDKYDETFFHEKALIVVEVTTNSGSTSIGIQSIVRDDSVISVTLSYEKPKIGTTDMATWLILAEVDKGLEDCQWMVSNPALESKLEKK